MSILSDILNKIMSHPLATQAPAAGATGDTGAPPASGPAPTVGSIGASVASAAGGAAGVDIQKVLGDLASKSGENLDWQHSIVDLLKTLGHDSSHAAREKLADELGYTGDKGDSAAMNEFLLKAVMKEVSQGGGKLPSGQ